MISAILEVLGTTMYTDIYTSAHGSGRRYSVLLLNFSFFFFLFFLSPKDLRDGCTNREPQMVGYRCNFKNWVQNLGGGRPPL